MFQGSENLGPEEHPQLVSRAGGVLNASTNEDRTDYFETMPPERLNLALWLEAERMRSLRIDEEVLRREIEVVKEERRLRVDNAPYGTTQSAALYDVPYSEDTCFAYAHTVIGSMEDLDAASADDVRDFFDTYYAPNNATLVVAGDVEADAVLQLAEKHFGPIAASGAVVARDRPQEPSHRAARRVRMHDPRVSELIWSRAYLAPQRRAGEQSQAAALVVLAELLGGSPVTSVMGRELVLGEGVALEAGAFYSDVGVDAQRFDLHLVPKPGVGFAAAEAALDALIANFIRSGPDRAQLERIKGQIRAAEIFVLDDLGARASRVGSAVSSGLTLHGVARWPNLLQEVTAEDVQAAAQSLFRIENSVTCWLAPPDVNPEDDAG
jgi:zinc protease